MTDVRSIYKNDIDFKALALECPAFNNHLKRNGQLDFSDPKAVQQLTKSLLKRDFNVELDLPDDRLCPPVPNRLNYVFWVQDLLDTTNRDFGDFYDPNREVTGLDIGTGSSCIIPLLCCAQRPKWRFGATDIDEKNLQYARQNILQNQLKSRIRPLLTTPTDLLISLDKLGLHRIDFTVCNPPFYSSRSDLLASATAKSRPPHSACTGADVEMVTPGGEVAFVSRMIDESLRLKTRCQWYTSMLGKLSSVGVLVEKLKSVGIENYGVQELIQGGRTRRWAIAWSWESFRPAQHLARGIPGLPKHLLPFPAEYTFTVPFPSTETATEKLNRILDPLDLRWQYRPSISAGVGLAKKNVWSRAARRQRKKPPSHSATHASDDHVIDEDDDDEDDDDDETKEPALRFKIQLQTGSSPNDDSSIDIMVRWLQGRDGVLFESFCGMLKRQMTTEVIP